MSGHARAAELELQIDTLAEQMTVYRTRIDELNSQLVTLRKVPQATELRRHLAGKMQETSQQLQRATMRIADLEGGLLAVRIELQSGLAELPLAEG